MHSAPSRSCQALFHARFLSEYCVRVSAGMNRHLIPKNPNCPGETLHVALDTGQHFSKVQEQPCLPVHCMNISWVISPALYLYSAPCLQTGGSPGFTDLAEIVSRIEPACSQHNFPSSKTGE